MPKSETVSTAAKPEDLEKAYLSATKALSVLGIRMAVKKPDPAKLGPIMTKSKKKAAFKLTGDAKMLKLTVECDNAVNTLGLLDLAGERDAERRAAVMKAMFEAGWLPKADYEKARAEADKFKGPDPKVVANLQRDIAEVKKRAAAYAALKDYDEIAGNSGLKKEFYDFAKKVHAEESIDFLDAVKARMKQEELNRRFLDKGGRHEINLNDAARRDAKAGKLDQAVKEVKALIKQDMLMKFRVEKAKEHNAKLDALGKQLASAASPK